MHLETKFYQGDIEIVVDGNWKITSIHAVTVKGGHFVKSRKFLGVDVLRIRFPKDMQIHTVMHKEEIDVG